MSRDGPVAPAYTYPYSDGGDDTAAAPEGPWDVYVGEAKPDGGLELPGPFPILGTAPLRYMLVAGPTFRNEVEQTELGAGFGFVNGGSLLLPFEFSVEPTWVRVKRMRADRHFRRVRLAGTLGLWERGTAWGGTAIAVSGFFENQNDSFSTLELGGAVTQVIKKRLSITANLDWGREWVRAGPTTDAPITAFGTSYNLGAGLHVGGFYQLYDRIAGEDDWGMFVSYQLLPFAELVIDGGKNELILAKLLISYRVE